MSRCWRYILAALTPPRLSFGSSAPTPPPPPPPMAPPPTLQSPQGAAAGEDAARRARSAFGASGTIMTGPQGATTPALLNQPQLTGKTTLGG